MIEVAATLDTVHAYARRDRACSESAAQPTRGAVAIGHIQGVRGLGAARLLRLSWLLWPRYAFATVALVASTMWS